MKRWRLNQNQLSDQIWVKLEFLEMIQYKKTLQADTYRNVYALPRIYETNDEGIHRWTKESIRKLKVVSVCEWTGVKRSHE